MKTILIFGDSLTWGSDPATGGRHPRESRIDEVIQAGIGDGYKVLSDGLRGRTTAYDENLADCDRNGARLLPTLLYSHAPLDLVVLILGSNDMKPHIAGTAIAAMQGMSRLVAIVQNHVPGPNLPMPQVLIVSPPPLCETQDRFFGEMFAGGVQESPALAGWYQQIADDKGCAFFDGGSVAQTSAIDGIHLDADNTVKLGKGIAGKILEMLN